MSFFGKYYYVALILISI